MRGSSSAANSAPSDASSRAAPILAHAFFGLLLAGNAVRIVRHAMWRDELQAFLIARWSAGPLELLHNLRYEGHGALWHLLLWGVTRASADPRAMQLLQLAVAAGAWGLIWLRSPFGTAEKFLLLLGYFLFWEYFVLSRGYGLIALLGFGYVALREARRRRPGIGPWVLLGFIANSEVYGAIWSIPLALALAWDGRARRRDTVIGVSLYVALFAAAVAVLRPAPDVVPPYQWQIQPLFGLSLERLVAVAAVPVRVFLPFDTGWLVKLSEGNPAWPQFFNPRPLAALHLLPGPARPLLLGAAAAAGAGAAAWLFARRRRIAFSPQILLAPPVAALALGWLGVLAFLYIYQIPVSSRYAGVLFLMLVAAMWQWRRAHPGHAARWWLALLVLNAAGGLYTLRSEFVPFSQARAVAQWLEATHLAGGLLVAYEDGEGASIGAYLGRPLYGIECQCDYTFVEWNVPRVPLDDAEILRRTRRAMARADAREAILIRNVAPLHPPHPGPDAADLSVTPLRRFADAEESEERYAIYRVELKESKVGPVDR